MTVLYPFKRMYVSFATATAAAPLFKYTDLASQVPAAIHGAGSPPAVPVLQN